MGQVRYFIAITEEIKNQLQFLAESGCPGFDCSKESLEIIRHWGKRVSPRGHQTRAILSENLEAIRKNLGDCRRCKLSHSRTHIVFGSGNPKARLVFVGDAPGYDEDSGGEPFAGASGELLTKIIQAMKLSREQVYLCNIVKCRPPGTRDPEPGEIRICLPFLKRQLKAVSPEFVCTLGTLAAQTLLETTEPLSTLRGRFYDCMGFKLIPTYHPEDILREKDNLPEYNRLRGSVWEDVKRVMKGLGID